MESICGFQWKDDKKDRRKGHVDMKNKRRIFAWMLCLVLLGAASPMRVNAEDEQQSEEIVLYEEGGKPEYTEAEAEATGNFEPNGYRLIERLLSKPV